MCRWLGKSSPDRNGIDAIAASPTRQSSQNAGTLPYYFQLELETVRMRDWKEFFEMF